MALVGSLDFCLRGLVMVDHEQLQDEVKQSTTLGADGDKLPATYQPSDPGAGPTVPSYKPTLGRFINDYNLLPAIGRPDAEYDLVSCGVRFDEEMYRKGLVDDGNEKLPTTYNLSDPGPVKKKTKLSEPGAGPTGPSYKPSSAFRPRDFYTGGSFTEEEGKMYDKIVRETDGFGRFYVPPGVFMPGLLLPDRSEGVYKDREVSTFLYGLAELAVRRYNNDNETSYQVVKIIRVNSRLDAGTTYNMTFQARDDKAESPPQNFQARIHSFGNETKVYFCRFEEEPKPIQDPDPLVPVEQIQIPWCQWSTSSIC